MNKLSAIIVSVISFFSFYAAISTAGVLVLEYDFEGNGVEIRNNAPTDLYTKLESFALKEKDIKSPVRRCVLEGNKALYFDGDSMLKVGPNSILDSIESYTIMAWVWYTWEDYPHDEKIQGKDCSNPSEQDCDISREDLCECRQEIMEKYGAFWMNIRRDTKKLRVAFPFFDPNENSIKNKRRESSVSISPRTWTHVAATFNPDLDPAIKIYTNGNYNVKANPLSTLTCPDPTNHHPLIIGGRHAEGCRPCPDAYFKGFIDDVRIYSDERSAAFIGQIINKSSLPDSDPFQNPCPSLNAPTIKNITVVK